MWLRSGIIVSEKLVFIMSLVVDLFHLLQMPILIVIVLSCIGCPLLPVVSILVMLYLIHSLLFYICLYSTFHHFSLCILLGLNGEEFYLGVGEYCLLMAAERSSRDPRGNSFSTLCFLLLVLIDAMMSNTNCDRENTHYFHICHYHSDVDFFRVRSQGGLTEKFVQVGIKNVEVDEIFGPIRKELLKNMTHKIVNRGVLE